MMSAEHTDARSGNPPGGRVRRRWLWVATAILILAAAFRLIALEDVPPGLAQDEVLDADIAQFIRGGEHALFFHHGYGHEPLYHYLAAPFAPLLGDNFLAIRLPSVYLGLLLVALTMRWARRDYGPLAALAAGAGLAVSWWAVIFSRIGIRPILEPLLLVAAVWFWPLRRVIVTRGGLLRAGLAGLFLGLAVYSYTAARIIPLLPALLFGLAAGRYAAGRRTPQQRVAKEVRAARAQMIFVLVVLGVCLLVYLPLGLTLRANPELQQRLEQLEGPLSALAAGDPGPVLRATAATVGVFSFSGDPRWTYGIPNRPLFDPLMSLLFYSGLLLALWRWRRPVYALLPVWLVVALLPSALSPDAPSTVRLIGALPVVYLLPGLAVEAAAQWTGSRARVAQWRRYLTPFLLVIFSLTITLQAYRTWRGGFIGWPAELETRLRYQSALRDVGHHWRAQGDASPVVAEVFYEPIDAATLRRVVGIDPAARWIQTGGGVSGALVWPSSQAMPRVYVPEYAPLAPELAAAGGVGEPVFRSQASPSFAVYTLPGAPAVDLMPVAAEFGRPPQVALRGHSAATFARAETAETNDSLHLFSWWEVLGPLPPDLAIFVHLVDDAGAVAAQFDGIDAAADTLRAGDKVLQRHVLPLPGELMGRYRLLIGLYHRGDGVRLATQSNEDTVELFVCDAENGRLACGLP